MTMQGKITGVRTVGIPVTDQDRALDFYVGTLGLEKRLDADMGGGRRWVEVGPAGAATSIALVRTHQGLPAGVETGIRVVTPDTDTVHAELRARGVDTGEMVRWEGAPPCSPSATSTATATAISNSGDTRSRPGSPGEAW